MPSPDWVRWYPSKWISGVLGLTLEQRGAYIGIINVILDRGECPEDYAYLARVSNCRRPRIKRIVAELVAAGKLTIVSGVICQHKAQKERRLSQQFSELQANRANKRWAETNKNNDLADAISGDANTPTPTPTPIYRKKELPPLSPPPSTAPPDGDALTKAKPNGQSRGSRLPADWQPAPQDCGFAERLGLDPGEVADAFADYWHAKPGQGGVKLDWSATWRNWCRREIPGKARSPRREYGLEGAAKRVVEAFRERERRMADDEGE